MIKDVLEEWCISQNWLCYATSANSTKVSVAWCDKNLVLRHRVDDEFTLLSEAAALHM